jgi:hypothetical protein
MLSSWLIAYIYITNYNINTHDEKNITGHAHAIGKQCLFL